MTSVGASTGSNPRQTGRCQNFKPGAQLLQDRVRYPVKSYNGLINYKNYEKRSGWYSGGSFKRPGSDVYQRYSSSAQSADSLQQENLPVSDTWLGRMWLNLLGDYLYYAPSFLMPTVTAAAVIGAVFGNGILQSVANLALLDNHAGIRNALLFVSTHSICSKVSALGFSLLTVLYAFFVLPVLDLLLGSDLRNPQTDEISKTSEMIYRGILYLYVPFHMIVMAFACHLLSVYHVPPLPWIGIVLSCGTANGIAFTVAHELVHGHKKIDKILSNALLATLCYMHWSKSHLIHHVKVATPEDPTTAYKGESIYHFIPRSVVGNTRDAYEAEAARRKKKGIPYFDVRNKAIWWITIPACIASASYLVYGIKGLCMFLGQAAVGIVMLEVVNYLEHYGLLRKKMEDGRYEKTAPKHSWNASTVYTNSVSFKLQRHSDHHAHEGTPYYLLKNIKDAPQLPAGYPAMMLLCLIPPLFFKVMDPLVEAVEANEA